jgi:hypothetical protein
VKNVAIAAFTLAALAASPAARAWGVAGHAVVADIAEARLKPAALTQVYNLLALDLHGHLDEISSWAGATGMVSVLRHFAPQWILATDDLGRAMITIGRHGAGKAVLVSGPVHHQLSA